MADTLYAARAGSVATSDLYTVNPATAATTSVGPTGYAITGLAFDPTSGILYGVTSPGSGASPKSLITVDPLTGAGTLVGSLGGKTIPDIAFDSTGQLYGWKNTDGVLTKINKTTGALTNLGASGIGGGKVGLGIAITSVDVCYLFPKGSTANYYTMNLTTGAATLVGSLDGSGSGTTIAAAGFDGADLCWAVNGDGGAESQLDTIDVATGAKTLVGALAPGGGTWDALVWQIGGGGGTPPVFVSAAVNGNQLTVVFDQPLKVSPGPAPSEFTVTADTFVVPVTAASVSGSDCILTLAHPISADEDVRVTYTAP